MKNNNRRNFLKSLGTIGLGATLVAPISALADNAKNENVENAYAKDEVIKVNILQTTDIHCQVHPHDELFWENNQSVFRKTGGYAQITTLLNQLKKKYKHTFSIDTGDMFQGSELSMKTTGKAFVPILNAMNYDLYLPGNWEVIYGKRSMQTLLGSLNAPKICANMYHDLGEGKRGELIFQPYHIWNVAGVKIGFIGYTDPLVPIRQSPNYSKGILYTKPEENLAHYVDVLKNQEQCSAIMIIAHLGLSQQIALANMPECEGVSYILGGDTHERVRVPILCKYAKVVEPGAFGSFIGNLELSIKNGVLIGDKYDLIEVKSNALKPNKEVLSIISENEHLYKEHINEIVGYSKLPLYRYFVIENPIDTMIIEALKWKFSNVDVVLSNGFRFCPPRSTPDKTGNIPITNGYLFDMLPIDSNVRIGKVTGAQISKWLEKELNNVFAKDAMKRFGGWVVKFEGMKVEFKAFAEEGQRVQKVEINGEPLNLEKTYQILACERDGDPEDMLCRMKNVKEPKTLPNTLHQTMKEYLKAFSPISPLAKHNAVALDAPETLLTQVYGVDYTFR
jgi:2',3'-cyclic-nucleotide 2'-phosphodiesterase (5'-nucleotidase family)